MISASRPILFLFALLSYLALALAQDTAAPTVPNSVPLPTPDTNPPPASAVDPNAGVPFVIIDKEWTQLFIGMGSILISIIGLTSIYGFLWLPWYETKMREAEKVYTRLEKERLGGGGKA